MQRNSEYYDSYDIVDEYKFFFLSLKLFSLSAYERGIGQYSAEVTVIHTDRRAQR